MLRCAVAQLRVGLDRADNLRRAAALIDAAAREGAALVALPECFTGKYGVEHFANWQEVVPASAGGDESAGGAAMMAAAAKRHGISVTGGIVERCDRPHGGADLFNSMPVFGPDGRLAANYRKVHLSRVLGVTSESDVFARGEDPVALPVADFRVGMACCFDLRFPALLHAYGPWAGEERRVDIVCAPSAFLHATGVDHWELLVKRTALDTQAYVLAPDVAYDSADEVPLHGKSMICDPWGSVIAQTAAEGDDLAIADVSRERLGEGRQKLNLAREGQLDASWYA